MNRSAAIARDLAEFFIEKRIKKPSELSFEQYEKLNPPYRIMRLKIHFLNFKRAMSIAENHMERLRSRTPSVSEGRTERLAEQRKLKLKAAAIEEAAKLTASKEKASEENIHDSQ